MCEYKIIAVDFDGTLCVDRYPEVGYPNYKLIALIKKLQQRGSQIILWTCRCGTELEVAVNWCRTQGLKFDAINANVPQIIEKYGSDSRKIYADVYIDDKACFPWEQLDKEEQK